MRNGTARLRLERLSTRRRHSLFDHVRRFDQSTPAHAALRLSVDSPSGIRPGSRWRPRRSWISYLEEDQEVPARRLWSFAENRKELVTRRPFDGSRVQSFDRPFATTRCLTRKINYQSTTLKMLLSAFFIRLFHIELWCVKYFFVSNAATE